MDDMLENAQHLRIEGSKLKGVLRNQDGGWHNAELDLDKWIGNSDGESQFLSPPFHSLYPLLSYSPCPFLYPPSPTRITPS